MSAYLLIPIVEIIFGLALLTVLIINGKRHVARMPFALFLVFMTLWGFFIYMMRAASGTGAALTWEKLVFISILTASMLFYWFSAAFTGIRPRKYFLYPLLLTYIAVTAFIPTGLVVKDVQIMWYGKAPVIGPLFPLYVLAAYAPIIRSAMILIRHSRQTRVIDEKVRDQYVIAGIIAMFTGATTDYLPVIGVTMYPLGIIGNILFCIIATAAMLKHNLLEMKVVLRKGITLSLTSLLIFGVFGTLVYLLTLAFPSFMSPAAITMTMLVVFIAALVFQSVFYRLQKVVDRWFFRERYDHIQTLKRFNRDSRADLNLEQLSSALVTAAANGMQSQGVYLLLPSSATGNFGLYVYSGQKNRGRFNFNAHSSLVLTMKQADGIIDSLDMDVIPSLMGLSAAERQLLENNRIELLVPMRNEGHLAGMLMLGSKVTRKPYTIEERGLLQVVAAEAAAKIENASLYENIKHKHSELEKAMDGVIHAMSLVVESRDPYTAGHQRRVAELARAIARKMSLSEWDIMGIHIAGLLHDVGKVAVPSEILSKPGKISHYEFSIIKNHPQIGYEILQKIDFPWPVTTAILQHHERINGSGYPAGLSDNDITLEARILGVADVVEAMSSHRPYRPALGLGSALDEISRNRGILYDPTVVDACLSLLEKNEPAFEELMAAAASQENIPITIKK